MLSEYADPKTGQAYLGRYEGLTPFHAYIADHADELADDSFGDTDGFGSYNWIIDCPHIMPNRRRAFLVSVDSQGFHYVEEYTGPNANNDAGRRFDDVRNEYDKAESEGEPCQHHLVGEVVTVRGQTGVAFYIDRCEINDGEPTLHGHMVGDDRDFVIDEANVTVLTEDDYCPGCGQIGCGWH